MPKTGRQYVTMKQNAENRQAVCDNKTKYVKKATGMREQDKIPYAGN
jgi:hypothetical protein